MLSEGRFLGPRRPAPVRKAANHRAFRHHAGTPGRCQRIRDDPGPPVGPAQLGRRPSSWPVRFRARADTDPTAWHCVDVGVLAMTGRLCRNGASSLTPSAVGTLTRLDRMIAPRANMATTRRLADRAEVRRVIGSPSEMISACRSFSASIRPSLSRGGRSAPRPCRATWVGEGLEDLTEPEQALHGPARYFPVGGRLAK